MKFAFPIKFLVVALVSISSGCRERSDNGSDLQSKTSNLLDIHSLTKKSDSIDSFLSKFPNELRRNFTLMHHSLSEHSATTDWQNPRVILFGDSAKTLVAFDGKANFAEVIQYNDDLGRFNFMTIVESFELF